MRTLRLSFFVLMVLLLSTASLSAQSIKKKAKRNIERKPYTAFSLELPDSPKDIEFTLVKHSGEIETKYWLHLTYATKFKTAISFRPNIIRTLILRVDGEERTITIDPNQTIRTIGEQPLAKNDYQEITRIALSLEEITAISQATSFGYTLILDDKSSHDVKFAPKKWAKVQKSLQKLLASTKK